MRFAPWASAGSAARSPLGTPMWIGVLRAPCRQPWRHSAPVFVEVFSCGEVVCSATLPEDLRTIDRQGPEMPVQQQSAFLSHSLRISLTSAQRRLHLLSGVFSQVQHF